MHPRPRLLRQDPRRHQSQGGAARSHRLHHLPLRLQEAAGPLLRRYAGEFDDGVARERDDILDEEEVLRGDAGGGAPPGEGLGVVQLPPPAPPHGQHGVRCAGVPDGAGEEGGMAAGPGQLEGADDTGVQPHLRHIVGRGAGGEAGEEVCGYGRGGEGRQRRREGGEAGGLLHGGGGLGWELGVGGIHGSGRSSSRPCQGYR